MRIKQGSNLPERLCVAENTRQGPNNDPPKLTRANNLCLISDNPTCSVSAQQAYEKPWSCDYSIARLECTPYGGMRYR